MVQKIYELAQVLSLALTVPAVWIAFMVVWEWRKDAHVARRTRPADRHPVQWLILGVFVSFVGSIVDNVYWGAAWLSSYYETPVKDALFGFGVYPNIVFRQGALVLAAYYHLKAAQMYDMDPKLAKRLAILVWLAAAAGLLSLGFLIYTRSLLT